MEKNFWLSKWKNKNIGFDQKDPNQFLLKYFDSLDLKPGARIFVPLCGKSIDMIWLMKKNYQIIGVELSLEGCHLFFQENKITYHETKGNLFRKLSSEKVTLLSGDIFDLDKSTLGKIDAIYDNGALVALNAEMRNLYVKKIISLLDPLTQIFLITMSFNQCEMPGPPFSVDDFEVVDYFKKNFVITQLHNEPTMIVRPGLKAMGLTQSNDLIFKIVSI